MMLSTVHLNRSRESSEMHISHSQYESIVNFHLQAHLFILNLEVNYQNKKRIHFYGRHFKAVHAMISMRCFISWRFVYVLRRQCCCCICLMKNRRRRTGRYVCGYIELFSIFTYSDRKWGDSEKEIQFI